MQKHWVELKCIPEISGLSDYLAEDEMDALRICREVVSYLNWNKDGEKPNKISTDPIYKNEELLGLISEDLNPPVDIKGSHCKGCRWIKI